MDSEIHTVALVLRIYRVKLSVRFPCSLTFQLKSGNSFVIKRTRQLIAKQIISWLKENVHQKKLYGSSFQLRSLMSPPIMKKMYKIMNSGQIGCLDAFK